MSNQEKIMHLNKDALNLLRLEYLMGFIFSIYLFVLHFEEINWWVFIALFSIIDLVGYIPGMIRTKVKKSEVPEKIFYLLYNLTHNLSVIGVFVAICWYMDWLSWSFLAIPIHLFGDRGVFGNFYKPYQTPYNSPSIAPAAH